VEETGMNSVTPSMRPSSAAFASTSADVSTTHRSAAS
jgi:hypothetical protein